MGEKGNDGEGDVQRRQALLTVLGVCEVNLRVLLAGHMGKLWHVGRVRMGEFNWACLLWANTCYI